MARLFGTDGVRGLANRELTANLALSLAQAAAAVLTQGRHAEEVRTAHRRPVAVIARDPRVSGEFLVAAVAAGLASSGVDVQDAGVIPTPALWSPPRTTRHPITALSFSLSAERSCLIWWKIGSSLFYTSQLLRRSVGMSDAFAASRTPKIATLFTSSAASLTDSRGYMLLLTVPTVPPQASHPMPSGTPVRG